MYNDLEWKIDLLIQHRIDAISDKCFSVVVCNTNGAFRRRRTAIVCCNLLHKRGRGPHPQFLNSTGSCKPKSKLTISPSAGT